MWQAGAAGIHPHPDNPPAACTASGFCTLGRLITDSDTGLRAFDTIGQGSAMGRNSRPMVLDIDFWLVSRGTDTGLNSRMYVQD